MLLFMNEKMAKNKLDAAPNRHDKATNALKPEDGFASKEDVCSI